MIARGMQHWVSSGLCALLAVVITAPEALSFGSGAATCDIRSDFSTITSMGSRPRNQNPGSFTLTPDAATYMPGQPVTVTLSGPTYTGVSMVAVDESGNRVGSWVADPGGATKITSSWPSGCNGQAITHTSSFGNRTTFDFEWVAPATPVGRVWFEAYVLEGTRGNPAGQEFYRFVDDDGSSPFVDAPAIVRARICSGKCRS